MRRIWGAVALIALLLLSCHAYAAQFVFANRAWVASATTGTGTITLGSAQAGYGTFAQAGVADGNIVGYVITDGNNFEIGHGTYTASGTTLARTTIFYSMTSGTPGTSALTLSGSETVYLTPSAIDLSQSTTCPSAAQSLLGAP